MWNTTMQGKFGKHSALKQWVNTMTYALRVMCICWLMCSKASERPACNTILDPCHYFTSPGLSWDAMLKMTSIELELITNVDMFQFIEKGMRGGVSYIANQHGKANNKYMEEYNEESPSKYILYLNARDSKKWVLAQTSTFLPLSCHLKQTPSSSIQFGIYLQKILCTDFPFNIDACTRPSLIPFKIRTQNLLRNMRYMTHYFTLDRGTRQ